MGFTAPRERVRGGVLQGGARPAGPHGRRASRASREDAAAEVRRAAELGVRALKIHPPHMARGAQRLPARARRPARDLRRGAAAAPAGHDPHRHLDLPRRAQPDRRAHGRGRRGRGLPRTSRSSSPTAAGRSGWSRPSSWCGASRSVYMDVSSIPPKAILRYFPRLAEVADKVLYGSDWPAPGVRSMARQPARLPRAGPAGGGARQDAGDERPQGLRLMRDSGARPDRPVRRLRSRRSRS